MAGFDPVSAGLGFAGAALGAIGSKQAADAQESAARQAANVARRNAMMGLQINEPMRYSGYQALNDINNFFGYSTSPYATQNQLATTLNPLTSKQVKQALKGGASFDQIAAMGTLGGGDKSIKRLMKAGLSMDQIQQLRTGMPQQQAPAPAQGGSQGGGENWSVFTNSPDYQFALQQGTKNAGNSFAARGGAASGNALRALSEFNQGLASNQIDKFLSRRMGLVNGGQQAIGNVQNSGQNYANNMMGATQAQGDARASGILGMTNSGIGGLYDYATGWGRRLNNYNTGNMGGLDDIPIWQKRI